jgi:hypothetical protein
VCRLTSLLGRYEARHHLRYRGRMANSGWPYSTG